MLDLYVNIRNRRKELGMSQEELAKKVGYTSRSTIARIENGEIDISRSKILAFADALKTTPGELMGLDGVWENEEHDHSTEAIYTLTIKRNDDLYDIVYKAKTDTHFRERLMTIAKLLGETDD